jgi:hypothetical protein
LGRLTGVINISGTINIMLATIKNFLVVFLNIIAAVTARHSRQNTHTTEGGIGKPREGALRMKKNIETNWRIIM